MTKLTTKIGGAGAVGVSLSGKFNPAIFHPAWFQARSLLTEEEASRALKVTHPEMAAYETDWVSVTVAPERYTAVSQQPPLDRIREHVLETFDLLRHTPMNRVEMSWRIVLTEAVVNIHELVARLVPPATWSTVLPGASLADLSMRTERPDSYDGYVEANVISLDSGARVLLVYVDRIDVEPSPAGCESVMNILRDRWDHSQGEAVRMARALTEAG
jgi:hypothetical protein